MEIRRVFSFLGGFWGVSVLACSFALADGAPECPAYGRSLPVKNAQVLHWKRTTPNQFRERAHVEGPVTRVFPDRSGHEHFEIRLGKRREDVLEVIYNTDFGAIPEVGPGMQVRACGDYITATARSGPYPPSPSGAIIHWVHMNPSGRGHEPGFLVIEGALYGQEIDREGGDGRRFWSPEALTEASPNAAFHAW